MAAERDRYRIAGCGNIFRTGRSRDGHQLLIGVQLPNLIAVFFDADGTFERVMTRRLHKVVTEPDDERVGDELNETILALAFEPSTIEVKEFFLTEWSIGIKQLPDHYEEVINEPGSFDEVELRMLRDDIRQWIDRGDFVLYWIEDYYLNRDGEVESS